MLQGGFMNKKEQNFYGIVIVLLLFAFLAGVVYFTLQHHPFLK